MSIDMDTLDLSQVRLESENEIDNAIYAVLVAAFGVDDSAVTRAAVRRRLPRAPAPAEIIDAVCAELKSRGALRYEMQRRQQAGEVLAAFLDLPRAEREDVSLMSVA